MKTNADIMLLRTNLKIKHSLILTHEGANDNEVAELSKNKEKWLKAVEYFTCVDDVNF
ncbi:hypothetical protein [uncultured Methanomethylovorans sp.]|uniref:hypothetical protein n=1 Tax=uncultured Methanomethylovorans sp. TaxID=183759 RepID=UPI002AA69B3D|nr:hypothetical protein [uncultured Methanomethylovorans sp.]